MSFYCFYVYMQYISLGLYYQTCVCQLLIVEVNEWIVMFSRYLGLSIIYNVNIHKSLMHSCVSEATKHWACGCLSLKY